ncbi:MAG: PH domain-containing protein [Chloroflexi bacterium CFX1]|nr:PH domain-containing protein [Chloroflexi bacterium CFX1]MCK6567311.1 PH domain-containing protein [Anaerolineales bacterium]MCQ3954730.1 hypothetical protein [Chloroflexota bacterium]MDL1920845.1 PH domain-containing protein [Chloroflexi bacterium CFX5]NUQ59010.1 PH domain-containing protein [Anaerolineales bacterium]
MSELRVYKTSPAVIFIVALMFVILIGGVVLAVGMDALSYVILPAVIGFLLLAGLFAMQITKVTISDDAISAQNLLGTKSLRWAEVVRASGRGYSIKLHNQDGDVTLSISPQLPGYEEIVEFIGAKRPQLFDPNQYSEMRRGIAPYIFMFLFVTLVLGVSLVFVYSTMDSPDASFAKYAPLLVFVAITLAFGGMVFSVPRSLTLEGNALNLSYLIGSKSLRADEITVVQLSYTQSRNGKHFFINLHLKDRRNIRLRGLGVGLPVAYLVLKNWHKLHTQGQSANPRPALNDVAPNWSDKSWK